MREIKFRLWHRKNKAMYAHNFMWGSPLLHGGGYVRCVPFGDGLRHDFMGYGNEIQIEPQECEIMQFTELLDKDGKEIYEGDRLICTINGEPVGEPDRVQFKEGEFRLANRDRSLREWLYIEELDGKEAECNFIVDGNIYENRDLC